MKRFPLLSLIAVILYCFTIISCQRDLSDPGPGPSVDPPVTIEYVKATIVGRVVDEQNIPVSGAVVKAGAGMATTQINGEFELKNVSLNKDAGFLKVEKDGFFQGSRTFSVTEKATNYVSIELIKKATPATFKGSSGGTVTVPHGGSISFPSNAIVNNKTAYTGDVTVHAYFIDPTAGNFEELMPGNLQGINASNQLVGLQSFGMMAVELTGTNGEELQLDSGKKAIIQLPLASQLLGKAPSSIPLWHFNDSTGLWKEEGTAIKQGNNYVGEVSHFSVWNWDVPYSTVGFQAVIKDQGGSPLAFAKVIVEVLNDTTTFTYGHTNNEGIIKGKIPANQLLKIVIYNQCGEQVHTQQIGPFSTETDLGIITVSTAGPTAVSFSGTVENCSGNAVNNGFVEIFLDNRTYRSTVSNGSFSQTITRCSNTVTTATIKAFDLSNNEQGAAVNVSVNGNTVAAGTITACGTNVTEFFDFSIDTVHYNLLPDPVDTLRANYYPGGKQTMIFAEAGSGAPTFYMYPIGSGTGTFPLRMEAHLNRLIGGYRIFAPGNGSNITFTEYGPAETGYIAGTASGMLIDAYTQSFQVPFSMSFRIKRGADD